jgi:hypothetical protein
MHKSYTDKHNYCCEMMACYIQDEDGIVVYIPKFREYSIPVHDGGSSRITINFCPWCGKRLPAPLRKVWFDELERMGIEDWDDPSIPEKYKSEAWWKTDKID